MSTPWPPDGKRPPSRLGRPRDAHLTERLKDQALQLVADQGLTALNADVLAARTGAGKGGIYRRWDTMAALVADALTEHHLIPDPTHSHAAVDDLCALLEPFTVPLTTAERVASAIIGPARSDTVLAGALHATVVDPLSTAVASIMTAHTAPGTSGADPRNRLMQTVVMALWWDRYISAGPVLDPGELRHIVTQSLLPVLRHDHA